MAAPLLLTPLLRLFSALMLAELMGGWRGEAMDSPLCHDSLESPARSSGAVTRVLEDTLCRKRPCPSTSFCFLGSCMCHPGYDDRARCSKRLPVANMWYTTSCPNLQNTTTYQPDTPLHAMGGEHSPRAAAAPSISSASAGVKSACGELKACAYLCYSHPSYGTAVVPHALWAHAQTAEAQLWASVGGSIGDDRAEEHWKAFANFQVLVDRQLANLGTTIEVGAGPWTQVKGMLHIRPELRVQHLTVWEPAARKYVATVPSCSYRSQRSLLKWKSLSPYDVHPFPVRIVAAGGEDLPYVHAVDRTALSSLPRYDTAISINVLEHVRDAFAYLSNLFLALRPGGMLILHERFYDDVGVLDGDRFHPVRLKRAVFDRLLLGFDVLFNNCSAGYGGRKGEQGYYVIATKRQAGA